MPSRRSRLSIGGRKRLWIVNHYAVTQDMPGGTRHSDFAEILKDHGWDTTIFASSFNHNTHRFERKHSFTRLVHCEVTSSTTWIWIPTFPYQKNDWKRYVGMIVFTMLFILTGLFQKRPHVIIGSSGHLLAPLGAWLIARWHRVPFLLEIRDVWPDGLIELGLSNPSVIWTLRTIERFLYRRADAIIVVADGIGDRLLAKGVPASKLISIPHGVNVSSHQPDEQEREAFRGALGWTDHVVIIWAGGLQFMNGLDTLVDAARLLCNDPRILIVLVGDGSERQGLEDRAKDLPNVRFYGSVPKTEIMTWLRAADIGVMTSRKFPTFTGTRPRKMLDYMVAGLPVVCNIPGEATRVVEEAGCGIGVEWENSVLLANAIRELSDSTELRQQLGAAGRQSVKTNHSMNSKATQLADLLSRCMEASVNAR